jgi:hypothetical protein
MTAGEQQVPGGGIQEVEADSVGPRPARSLSDEQPALGLRLLVTTVRFALSAWVGAAVLFVVNAVRQTTYPGFDSLIRNQLALLRFPSYYLFGFALVGGSCVGLVWLAIRDRTSRSRWIVGLVLVFLAVAILGWDYCRIYKPLTSMIDPPDQPRSSEFGELHRWSEIVNSVQLTLVLLAALLVSWPRRADGRQSSR